MIATAKLELIAHRGRVTRVRDENTIKAFKKCSRRRHLDRMRCPF